MTHDDNIPRSALVAAGAAVAAGAPLRPQARAKGPLVWLDMDQQALDDAYDQIVYAPNREQVTKRRIANSERARAAIGAPERVAYGPTEIEKRRCIATLSHLAFVRLAHRWLRGDP